MRTERIVVTLLLVGLAAAAVLSARRADAIPAFARKYQFSCSTCHAPFPRLKPFGEAFAARGFRMEDPAKEPSRATFDVGDPLLQLPRDLPLAMRMDAYASFKDDSVARSDFEWPWAVKILSGGPITGSISYYVYGILEQGESVKLEDTFLQFSSVLGLPVDLTIGQFQVSDPLFKRELRLEREDYAIFKRRVGVVPTNLTYDRGMVFTWHAPWAIEVVGEVVNGNGIEPAENDAFDDGTYKNTALRVVRQFGPVRFGLFGYQGRADLDGARDRIRYLGPDLVVDLGEKWQFNAQFLRRTDTDPFLVGHRGSDYVTEGGFAELLFFPRGQDGRWVVATLYNKVNSDDAAARYESVAITGNYLLARNVRLVMEGARDLEADANRLSIGVVTAF